MTTRLDVTKIATALRNSKDFRAQANALLEQAEALRKSAQESCPHPASYKESHRGEDEFGQALPSSYKEYCFLCEKEL